MAKCKETILLIWSWFPNFWVCLRKSPGMAFLEYQIVRNFFKMLTREKVTNNAILQEQRMCYHPLGETSALGNWVPRISLALLTLAVRSVQTTPQYCLFSLPVSFPSPRVSATSIILLAAFLLFLPGNLDGFPFSCVTTHSPAKFILQYNTQWVE